MTAVSQDQSTPGTADAEPPADRPRAPHSPRPSAEDAWAQAGLPVARPPAEHKEPYRTLAVLAVALGLTAMPVISLLGHRRLAIVWLGTGVLLFALLRLQRPDGTWMAARGRLFDVVFGIILALALLALTYYADLPRVV